MMGCASSKGCGCMSFNRKKISYEDESTSSCRSSEADVQVRHFRNRKIKPDGGLLHVLFPRNLFRGWRRNEELSMTKIERSEFPPYLSLVDIHPGRSRHDISCKLKDITDLRRSEHVNDYPVERDEDKKFYEKSTEKYSWTTQFILRHTPSIHSLVEVSGKL